MIDNSHLQHLVDDRAKHINEREAADVKVKSLNAQLTEALEANGLKRHQLLAGAVIQIIQPAPRKTIVGERLLEAGVKPSVIQGATLESPVTPFIRVDRPQDAAKGAPIDAAAAVHTGEPAAPPATPDAPPPTVN